MKRILITGMSGTGKSALTERLAASGYKAIDLDSDEYSEWVDTDSQTDPLTPVPGKDWRWKTARVQELLSDESSDILIVSGCAENMGQFLPQFDEIVLLSAPPDVIKSRLTTRTNNSYGKQPQELEQVLTLLETVEPMLRTIASCEIDTNASFEDVIARMIAIVRGQNQGLSQKG